MAWSLRAIEDCRDISSMTVSSVSDRFHIYEEPGYPASADARHIN